MINGKGGSVLFCKDCESSAQCDKQHQKIHPVTYYIYRYMNDIESGFKIYPRPGSWERQPEWFIYLLTIGQRELELCRNEKDGQ